MTEIKKVGVVGAGLMGHGIAQVTATGGLDVVLREVDDATLAKGLAKIEKQLARAVDKGRSTQEDADATCGCPPRLCAPRQPAQQAPGRGVRGLLFPHLAQHLEG